MGLRFELLITANLNLSSKNSKFSVMRTKIPSYKSYMYSEVLKIVSYRDGLPYKTESTNQYVLSRFTDKAPKGYLFSAISTSLTKFDYLEIDVVDITQFMI